MFLKRERPETDDFEIKEYLVVKEKYLANISLFQEITKILQTPLQNCLKLSFAYSCVSEHSMHFCSEFFCLDCSPK